MSSSTVKTKKSISSNNVPYEMLNPRNSVRLSSNSGGLVHQSQSWTDSRIKDEISSFIAEFSYIADGKDENRLSQQNKPRISLQTYQVYPAHLDENNHNKGFYLNEKRLKTSIKPKRKKSLVWKDEETKNFNNRDKDQTNSHFFRRPGTIGGRETRHVLPPMYNKLDKDDKYVTIQERPTSNQRSRAMLHHGIRHRPRSPSKMRSTSQSIKRTLRRKNHKPRASSQHNSKPRMVIRHTKYSYARSKRKIRPQPTDPRIKHIPLRYEIKKSRRHIMKPLQPVKKTHLPSPSIVTLYPSNRIREELLLPHNQYLVDSHIPCKCNRCQKKNGREKSKRHGVHPIQYLSPITSSSAITYYPNNFMTREEPLLPHDAEFFVNSHTSCKCWQCMRKRMSLLKMSAKRKIIKNKKFKTHFDSIMCQDWCYGNGVGLQELNRCTNETEIEYESSVHLKFNSYCQYFDPEITHYFHSILDQAYCV